MTTHLKLFAIKDIPSHNIISWFCRLHYSINFAVMMSQRFLRLYAVCSFLFQICWMLVDQLNDEAIVYFLIGLFWPISAIFGRFWWKIRVNFLTNLPNNKLWNFAALRRPYYVKQKCRFYRETNWKLCCY